MRDRVPPIPPLTTFRGDRKQILEETKRLLAIEEQDNRDLTALRDEMSEVSETTLWELMLRIIQLDNEKHRQILSFIRDWAHEPDV